MKTLPAWLGPLVAGALSLAGFVIFAVLFIPRMNVFWFILSPMIIAVYQIPAVVVYALWKRARRKSGEAGPQARPADPADRPAGPE